MWKGNDSFLTKLQSLHLLQCDQKSESGYLVESWNELVSVAVTKALNFHFVESETMKLSALSLTGAGWFFCSNPYTV